MVGWQAVELFWFWFWCQVSIYVVFDQCLYTYIYGLLSNWVITTGETSDRELLKNCTYYFKKLQMAITLDKKLERSKALQQERDASV